MRQVLRKYAQFWEVSLIIILLITAGTFFVSIALPFQYRSDATILIVQKQPSLDLFNAARASEYVSTILKEVVYTDSFINEVTRTDATLAASLSGDAVTRRRQWQRQLRVTDVQGAGILKFSFYGGDAALAQRSLQAVVNQLVRNASLYHGRGTDIELQVLDTPTLNIQPVRPRVILNTIGGFVASILLVGILFYLEDVYGFHLFRRRERHGQGGSGMPPSGGEQDRIATWVQTGRGS